MTNLKRKYPHRKRCATCRRYLSYWDAYEGLYCSWSCSPNGKPEEIPVSELPRQCRRRNNPGRGWVEKHTYFWIEEAVRCCPKNKNIYYCDHHRGWHIGGGKPRQASRTRELSGRA